MPQDDFAAEGGPGRFAKWTEAYGQELERLRRRREASKLPMISAASVKSTRRIWLYPDWLPQDELTLLVGAANVGKTTLLNALVAGVTRGKGHQLHPKLAPHGSGYVLMVNREDDAATIIRPGLEAAGADLAKVRFIDGQTGSDGESPFSFANERDMDRLLGFAEQINGNLGLITVDPVYFAVDGDFGNNTKARAAYERLASIARRLRCAVLGVAHTVRSAEGKGLLSRVAGPPAIREVPRGIMLMAKIASGPTTNGGTHILIHAKNKGRMQDGFEYRIAPTEATCRLVITGELIGEPEDLIRDADRSKPAKSTSKFDRAVGLLLEILNSGPRLRIEIERLAQQRGISLGTLLNAKTQLGIVPKKRNGDGRSVWRLSDAADVAVQTGVAANDP